MSFSDTAGPPVVSLDVADLVVRGRVAAGDNGDRQLRYLSALQRLLDAVESEAQLHPLGRQVLRDSVVAHIVTQIETSRLVEAHPEIEQIPVSAPIVITGMPRTGTTALHNLLAEHPDLWAPPLWELLAPAASTEPTREADLVRFANAYVEQYYAAAPAFRELHPIDALRPDECHRLLSATFMSPIYAQRYHVPTYLKWLSGQDMRVAYEFHRTLLRCLLWRRPGAQAVLKCPSHLWHLDALAAIYPGAKIIRLHRDPAANLASACNLTAVVRAASGAEVDRVAIGRHWLEHAWEGLSGLRQGDRYGADAPTLDIRQRDLRADPLGVAGLICEFAGVPWSSTTRHRLEHYLSEQSPVPDGAPGYSLADFGLDRAEVDRRFRDYRVEFDV